MIWNLYKQKTIYISDPQIFRIQFHLLFSLLPRSSLLFHSLLFLFLLKVSFSFSIIPIFFSTFPRFASLDFQLNSHPSSFASSSQSLHFDSSGNRTFVSSRRYLVQVHLNALSLLSIQDLSNTSLSLLPLSPDIYSRSRGLNQTPFFESLAFLLLFSFSVLIFLISRTIVSVSFHLGCCEKVLGEEGWEPVQKLLNSTDVRNSIHLFGEVGWSWESNNVLYLALQRVEGSGSVEEEMSLTISKVLICSPLSFLTFPRIIWFNTSTSNILEEREDVEDHSLQSGERLQ